MTVIPSAYRDLFDRPTIAQFATLTPAGYPHVTPVWIDYDLATDRVLVNTERHRRKTRNVERDPRVGIGLVDPDDPYRRLSIVGEVAELTTDGARDHIDDLSRRYVDGPYPGTIESERVLIRIEPLEAF